MEVRHSTGDALGRMSAIVRGCGTALCLTTLLTIAGCSDSASTTNPNQMPGTSAGTGASGTLAAAGTAGASNAGGASASTGSGVSATSGTGAMTAGRGGSSAAGSSAGASAASGAGGSSSDTAGAMATSTAGASAAGSGGAGTPAAAGCTRDLLKSTVDMYFTALAAHDPKLLPLADNAKFTENGMMQMIGSAGLWKTAGMAKYKHSALDTESCTSVSESVVPDGSTDIPLGLRIKLAAGKITEVETIAVRAGDYKVFGSTFPSNTGAISASRDRVKWEEAVPADQRNTRKEITDWLDRYFRTFPRGGCNFADNCQRLENGGGSFECSAALSCEMGMVSTTGGTLKPRLIIVDEELGIGVGFTLFMGNTDFHMIKMYGGKIYAVHAILGAAMSSGWD